MANNRTNVSFFILIIFSLISATSFIGCKIFRLSGNSSSVVPQPRGPLNPSAIKLNVLYLETSKVTSILSKKMNKVVFNYVKNSDNELTLLAWRGKRGRKFLQRDTTAFTPEVLFKVKGSSSIDLNGQTVLLGSFELSKSSLDSLRRFFKDSAKYYNTITLMPELQPVTSDKYLSQIVYQVFASNNGEIETLAEKRVGSFNPSPPRASY